MTICVVGAGFAGLRAAQLLERLGHDVSVFEARDRVGGRASTVVLEDGWFEAGGEWIDGDHYRVMALLAELGLGVEPSHQWPGLLWFDGETRPEDVPWGEVLWVEDQLDVLARQVLARFDSGDRSDDNATLASGLDKIPMDPRTRWCIDARLTSDEGEDPDRVGLLGWAVGYRHYLERTGGEMSSARFATGAQSVCIAMATRLRGSIRLGSPVREITPDGVVGLGYCHLRFDHVVCTLPPTLLETVIGDTLSNRTQQKYWEKMGSARAAKIMVQFRNRWWNEVGFSGRLMANRPFQQCWDIGRGGLCALGFYLCGRNAVDVLATPDPVTTVVESLAEIHPVAREQFVQGAVVDWISDPYSRGAFSSLKPGSVSGALPHTQEPLGRIHFAGEWASSWGGFYEGALESAERVAAQIAG